MKKEFEIPQIEVIRFEEIDVLTDSEPFGEYDDKDSAGWF